MKVKSFPNKTTRTVSDAVLDDLERLVIRICDVSLAFITSVDAERKWSDSSASNLTPEIFCETALYAYAIEQTELVIVNDAVSDERFAASPLIVSGLPVRFCAGIPLRAADGRTLGMLFILDFAPRRMNDEQRALLMVLARQALAHLEARRNIAELKRSTFSQNKQSEVELRASEERFFKAFDASPEPMTITKYVDGSYLYVNRSFVHNSGYTQMEITGRSTLELNIWANSEDSVRLVRLLEKQGNIYKEEIQFRTKSGEIRTGLFSAEIIDVSGERCILSLTHDITEQKQIEDALRESEAKYRSLIESLPAIVYLVEPQPPYSPIYVSPSIEELGYPLDDWFNRSDLWVSLLHPEDRERVLKDTQAAMLAERENDYEYRIIARDGVEHWVHDRGRFVLDKNGKPFCWQGVIIDISERKLGESRLAEMHRRLEESHDDLLSLLNQLRLGVVMVNENEQVTFLSQACQDFLGKNSEEIVGKLWETIYPFETPDKMRLRTMIELAPEKRTRVAVHVKSSAEESRWLEVDVQDDPRDSLRKNFFLYDVSNVYDLRQQLNEKAQFQDLIGKSQPMQMVYQQVREVAPLDVSVLIEGETGTGKELAARAIHFSSPRQNKPFFAVNCASLNESLLTSQLFGHKRGAFTGAVADHAGLFEAANGGTILLDEIGDMPIALQTVLLRVLQEREITRLGENKPRKIDVRILAATQHELREEIVKGNFRADLLYRIRVVRISLPPLRERREDIPLLVDSFLARYRAANGKLVRGISDEATRILLDYNWSGNVRELKSVVEVATIFCKGEIIEADDLPLELLAANERQNPSSDKIQTDEKLTLLAALEQSGGNRAAAARLLGIGRATLYRRLADLGINK